MTGATRQRTIFCISDHTGLTAENYARSLMSRFPQVGATWITRPFVDTPEKARAAVAEIDAVSGPRPVVFCTFSITGLQEIVQTSTARVIGLYDGVLEQMAGELGREPTHEVGGYHGIGDVANYQHRLDAVDFSLATDDGLGIERYEHADVILVGVSRTGKTPTCLYLSMQYGIRAANYPINPDDHPGTGLPDTLAPHGERLFGMTIDPHRLSAVRTKRRPDSPYSSLRRCQEEVAYGERLFRAARIPHVDTTALSIEEITATIINSDRSPLGAETGRHAPVDNGEPG